MARPRCAVLGSPIGHSLSPVLHRAAYAEHGLDWDYDAHEVDQRALPSFLDGLDTGWRGLSLTMPLKRAVLPLLDDLSEGTVRAGSANTVLLSHGRRLGDNTDVPGAAAAVTERHRGPLRSAVVVGGGATAAAVTLALADLGCAEVTLRVRAHTSVEDTVRAVRRHPRPPALGVSRPRAGPPGTEQTGPEIPGAGIAGPGVAPADIVAATVPAAALDHATAEDLLRRTDPAVVFDVAYDPWPTPLVVAARREGRVVVSGLDLLVHQAALQFRAMTGMDRLPLAVMRDAGERALGGG